jgi:hypothetical protein
MPLTGGVPSAAPDGSLPGTKVNAGRDAKPVGVGTATSRSWAEVGALGRARPDAGAGAEDNSSHDRGR